MSLDVLFASHNTFTASHSQDGLSVRRVAQVMRESQQYGKDSGRGVTKRGRVLDKINFGVIIGKRFPTALGESRG